MRSAVVIASGILVAVAVPVSLGAIAGCICKLFTIGWRFCW